jgi:hypothetical protein
MSPLDRRQLRTRIESALMARVSPERTRRATWLERMTVQRLDWNLVVRLNRWFGLLGKFTFGLWIAFVGTVVLGVDWKDVVQDAVNSGRPVKTAFALSLIVPTLLFVAARSLIGFVRWRLQRELWRRDVERLDGAATPAGGSTPAPAAPPSAPAGERPPHEARP